MANTKEYKKKLAEHMTAADMAEMEGTGTWTGSPIHPWVPYLCPDDVKALRKKNRGKFKLEGCNYRATVSVDPESGGMILTSYETDVCRIDVEPGSGKSFTKLWRGYSVTSMKHINAFRAFAGLEPMSKREWIMLPEGVKEK